MTLYRNRYRIETTRLPNWDYASDGWYYITICTKDRENIFGKIEQGIMQLNESGHIVEQCWFDLPNHYTNLILDAFVVMPDHLHGIMIIDNSRGSIVQINGIGIATFDVDGIVETGFKPVSTTTTTTTPPPTPSPTSSPTSTTRDMNHHGIFEFIRALKTFSSRRMNELDNTPGKSRWQPRYWDHIIRDEQELFRIRQYITDNPVAWNK